MYGVTPVQAGSCVVLQTEWDLVDTFFRWSVFNPNTECRLGCDCVVGQVFPTVFRGLSTLHNFRN